MLIYIDESGSINNQISSYSPYFIVAVVHAINKTGLQRAYKRFVSSNLQELQRLDQDKTTQDGKIIREGGKMFSAGKFKELKGSSFDAAMKRKFISFFAERKHFEVFFIRIDNSRLTDQFCSNTARVFNYTLRLAISYFIRQGLLPNEECILQLDERNERTETKYFLENYLNTELVMNGSCKGPFSAQYFDSANNKIIQVADVLSNWYYSHLKTGAYEEEYNLLKDAGILKAVFDFPL